MLGGRKLELSQCSWRLRRQVLQGFTRFCIGFARFSQGFREGLARVLLGFCKFARSLQWFCKRGARDLQGLARGLQGFSKEFARNLQGFAGPEMDRHGPERTGGLGRTAFVYGIYTENLCCRKSANAFCDTSKDKPMIFNEKPITLDEKPRKPNVQGKTNETE